MSCRMLKVAEVMSDSDALPVRMQPGLDARAIARVYAAHGRVHIPGFFTRDCAERIYKALSTELRWELQLNDGDKPISRDGASFDALSEEDRRRVMDTVYANAAKGFQYIFNNFPISDLYEQGSQRELYVMRVYEFLNSPDFLELVRTMTGVRTIAVVDAQATWYRPGHFLTRHDDLLHGKKRVAAYVLNFARGWKADWGGILQFIDNDGHVAEGYTPAFNALNVFRVPQPHIVSMVTPFAQQGRYSITGWLREA